MCGEKRQSKFLLYFRRKKLFQHIKMLLKFIAVIPSSSYLQIIWASWVMGNLSTDFKPLILENNPQILEFIKEHNKDNGII